MKFTRSSRGTDGFPCPYGCEHVVKDTAWWDERLTKLAEAKRVYPDAVMDAYGWFWTRNGRAVPMKEKSFT